MASFNTIKFVKGNSYREIWISDDYYRIATPNSPYGGKRHYGSVTKYISNMLSQGWKKVNTATYLHIKWSEYREIERKGGKDFI